MNRTLCRGSHCAGFTLIEIMVAVVILGILAAIVVPRVMNQPAKARTVKAKQDIRTLESALNMYRLDNYHYPSPQQGLQALVEKPSGNPPAPNWRKGGYIDHLPKDPWGQPYHYLNPGTHGNDRVDIYTLGADNQKDGDAQDADIGNWNLND